MIIENNKVITINTKNTSYQMKIGEENVLLHLYYGDKLVDNDDMSYGLSIFEYGFSPRIYEADKQGYSLDVLPLEYTSCGVGDFRINSIGVTNVDKSNALDLRYVKHEVLKKHEIKGMTSFRNYNEVLKVYLKDVLFNIEVILYYKVIEKFDVITRYVEVINNEKEEITINNIMSMSIDLPDDKYNLIHFQGAHVNERQLVKTPLQYGNFNIGSTRGTSSHHHNPFVVITKNDTTEDTGECLSLAFVYSGNFLLNTEVDYTKKLRVQMGINPYNFEIKLNNKETFITPEVAMCYTNKGLNEHTNLWTNSIKHCILNKNFLNDYSPILINNWEATYMNFNEEKLCKIVDGAKELGVEMFVLDDGWFGKRDDDHSSLGDYNIHKTKFPNGLNNFVEYVNKQNMKFGLWIEPEMISEDSDLYRSHPEYAFQIPNRKPSLGRNQLVLNLGNDEVVEYIFNNIDNLLKTYNIEYLKWDMNRNLTDIYDVNSSNQKNVMHNYVLGLYKLFEKITTKYPKLRIEGCSGGGGRYDLGMLYYQPQIWTSDNTDPIERLNIQYGTSFGYPVMTMGAHVSASPNHQTGRATPLKTRGDVAQQGTFGYELDLSLLSKEEKEIVVNQIKEFKEDREIIYHGRLHRLTDDKNDLYCATQYNSKESTLLYVVFRKVLALRTPLYVKLKGLERNSYYLINDQKYSGAQLMNYGLFVPYLPFDYGSHRFVIKKLK